MTYTSTNNIDFFLRNCGIAFENEIAQGNGIYVDFRDLPAGFDAPVVAKLYAAELEVTDKGFVFRPFHTPY